MSKKEPDYSALPEGASERERRALRIGFRIGYYGSAVVGVLVLAVLLWALQRMSP